MKSTKSRRVRSRGSLHGTKLAALRAPHTRAERRHRDVIRPGVDVDLVAASLAGDEQPADAEAAHVAQRHPKDRLVAARFTTPQRGGGRHGPYRPQSPK